MGRKRRWNVSAMLRQQNEELIKKYEASVSNFQRSGKRK